MLLLYDIGCGLICQILNHIYPYSLLLLLLLCWL